MSDHEVDRLHGLIHWVQRPGIKLAPASAALPFGPMATVRRGFLAADHAELCRAEVSFHGIAAASQRNLDQASMVRAFLPHNSSGRGIERRS
jgi:hypothetical protein